MSGSIQVFSNDEFGTIRAFNDENGETWFVAKDIANKLGYRDAAALTRTLDDDEKGYTTISTPGGIQKLSTINEYGFDKAVVQRRVGHIKDDKTREFVKGFQRWVTHEVLPSISKHGMYATPQTIEAMLSDPDTMIGVLQAYKKERERADSLQAENEVMEPKALFADAVAASDGTCLVGELAKMMTQAGFKVGQNRLFAILRDDGYLGKSGSNKNVPLQRYVEQGLFRIKETAITHADGHVSINRTTKVTGKGQRYFIDRYCKVQKLA